MPHTFTPTDLKTQRLILRLINQEIMDVVFNTLNQTDGMLLLGLAAEDDFETVKERHQKGLSTFNRTFLYFNLLDPNTMLKIGWCGYHTWYTTHQRAELGYVMTDDRYKEKGLMTEALKAVLDFGFNDINLNRVEAFVAPYNQASLKLLARFGFVQEGVLRQHYVANIKPEDSVLFGLLKEDYQSK